MVDHELTGAFAPVVTPFHADWTPDAPRFVAHCEWLLSHGAGLAPFGTNSEANSLDAHERMTLLDHLVGHGLDAGRMLPGTGCCSLPETVRLTRHAVAHGCAGVLMLPPFFYKGLTDDGLYAYYARVIDQVADSRLRVYLYHIPALSGVPITMPVIERLIRDFPTTVVGIKDSSGDWNHLSEMLDAFPGFGIFPASESLVSRASARGARGCISATVNINPQVIARLCREWAGGGGAALQAQADAVRGVVQSFPMIAALKAVLATQRDDPTWQRVRAPLSLLTREQHQRLHAQLAACGFTLPG
ncbi:MULTISPECIES: dihydrodipicolinate synthase family protein [Pandoraea]|uniref:Dihydrodipicolinate synthetase n=1 Tax=Pandoraea pnomenusa TaxID=93220 RepID=A0ABY6WFH6_9BURK|nr:MULTISPECIES: dihydrodipicolinate synthase family protein [Pandoraea]AHB05861.1 dihydrodipicolinate synthetase [Pandoraea pnomenusa 3kgm]AHB78068.2 dihydrodipicolinate synthase family protein [Pandoraea pnomenusa]AHN73637.1 dihydrodipicolinate synthase family protein [Pandoraea pnomenusa]ANC46738.1 dihydrodipicolinate synthase family protein [Pandoraea pnomenusa]MBN9092648.1 dihydrodipicolinate synthase family protein [Pandoraea pnomenusa]